jgi:hypothetical protein
LKHFLNGKFKKGKAFGVEVQRRNKKFEGFPELS